MEKQRIFPQGLSFNIYLDMYTNTKYAGMPEWPNGMDAKRHLF